MVSHGSRKGRSVRRKPYSFASMVPVAALLLLLAACGEQQGPAPAASASAAKNELTVAKTTKAFSSISYDYSPKTPGELKKMSTLVVVGTVVEVVAGRLEGNSLDDPFAARNSAVLLDLTSVTKGQARTGDQVWIELPIPPGQASVLSAGTVIGAYLGPVPASTPDYPYLLEGNEVPKDAVLYSAVHAQGLKIEVGKTGKTVEPYAEKVVDDSVAEVMQMPAN